MTRQSPLLEPAPGAPASAVVPGCLASLVPGEVGILGPLAVPGLRPRRVRIYLPRNPHRRNLLVLFDGQNVFTDQPSFAGGWHAHLAVERLARWGRPAPVVVGVDHGGEERIRELSPFPVDGKEGQLDLLLDWLTGTLLPLLGFELSLAAGPAGTLVGGSSMGGLAAFYAHWSRPESFGGALAMSPSFWLAEGAIFSAVAERPVPPLSRIYLDAGVREDRGRLLPAVDRMAEHLRRRGYGDDRLLVRHDPRGAHSEASWRRRLPAALRFMLGRR